MIKRYILHIEVHRHHLPRISFKRAPKHGDRVVDGGIPGTLKLCPECQEGFLHEPDSRPRLKRSRSKPSKLTMLERVAADLAKNLVERTAYPTRPSRSDHTPWRAMDFNSPKHVELKHSEPEPETPVVELTIVEPAEHVELKTEEHVELKSKDESPEELELDYELGTRKYKVGEVVWTHKAEYVVKSLTKKVLHLVRKDVWNERQKKSEHVELEVKEETPSEIVELNFRE